MLLHIGGEIPGASVAQAASEAATEKHSASQTPTEVRRLIREARYAEAESVTRELLSKVDAKLGPYSEKAGELVPLLAEILVRSGQTEGSEWRDLVERQAAIWQKTTRVNPPWPVYLLLLRWADLLMETGDYARARALFERARETIQNTHYPNEHSLVVSFARLLLITGDYDEAQQLLDRSSATERPRSGAICKR